MYSKLGIGKLEELLSNFKTFLYEYKYRFMYYVMLYT